MAKGKGAILTDVDGNEYIDYFCERGAALLGHADERVVVAVNKAMAKGAHLSLVTETKVRLAELIASRFVEIHQIELIRTDEEAAASAVRLARIYTGRKGIVTFDGGPHGHRAAAGRARANASLPYNDIAAAQAVFRRRGDAIAAVLLEPVATSLGLVPPADGFLEELHALCQSYEALLVFDETVSGFCLGPGGAAARFGVAPDLTLLGPVIGGGLPLAACGGRKEVMKHVSGKRAKHRPGPLIGFEPAMAAGVAVLQAVGELDLYATLEARAARLSAGLSEATAAARQTACHRHLGSLVGMHFTPEQVNNLATARTSDGALYDRYASAMLARGVAVAPSPYLPMFLSAAHTDEQIDQTVAAARAALLVAAGRAEA